MLYLTYLSLRRKEFTVTETVFWIGLWISFIAITIFPGITTPFVETLNLARAMDFFIILGFMFLIAAIFYCYSLVKKMQKKMEEIVRKIALK